MSEICKRCSAGVERVIAAMHPSGTGYMEGCANPYEPPRWIPVSERLPDPQEWFCGLRIDKERDFDSQETITRISLIEGYPGRLNIRPVPLMTHWQPLPEPPKE